MSTIELILSIFSTLTTSGLITLFIFYRSKRRTAAAEATGAEHTAESAALRNMHESLVEWKEIAEAREAKLDKRDELIDRLFAEKNEDRKENHALTSENAKLKLELQSAQFVECRRRGCADREPQTGY